MLVLIHPLLQLTIACILAICLTLAIRSIQRNISAENSGSEHISDLRYRHSSLATTTLDLYDQELRSFLQETKAYLNADLSLDELSLNTNIPKRHFSQLFNVHLQKNFYQLLAEYRIAYALEALAEEADLKIEYLANACGYHSRTTFTKHFKEQVGLTPSRYRENLFLLIQCSPNKSS